MGVQGVGIMEDEAEPNPIVPTPWCLFGFFLGIQKEARPASFWASRKKLAPQGEPPAKPHQAAMAPSHLGSVPPI